MKKDYSEEINFIKNANKIHNKLLIITIYQKYCEEILSQVPDEYYEHVCLYLANSFKFVVYYLNDTLKQNTNASEFFTEFFKYISMYSITDIKGIEFIDEVSKKYISNLNSYIDEYNFIEKLDIDQVEENNAISYQIRCELVNSINSYYEVLIQNIEKNYNEEEVTKIKQFINDIISEQIYYYMKSCVHNKTDNQKILISFIPAIMFKLKEALKAELNKNNLNLQKLKMEIDQSYLSNSNEKQSKIYLLKRIYDICGYDQNENPLTLERIKEVSYLLGTSFLESTVLIKEMPSYQEQNNNETVKENHINQTSNIITSIIEDQDNSITRGGYTY